MKKPTQRKSGPGIALMGMALLTGLGGRHGLHGDDGTLGVAGLEYPSPKLVVCRFAFERADRLPPSAGVGSVGRDVRNCGDPVPMEVFSTLGIIDDDGEWLCGADRPEPPHEYDVGVVAAGVYECLAGDGDPVPGGDLWVGPAGDDGNSGALEADPFRTLSAALCRVSPGQTVHLLPGEYGEGVVIGGLGNGDVQPVTIRGEGDDPCAVVLDGAKWRSFALGFVESRHIRIENLTVRNYTDEGIYGLIVEDVAVRNVIVRNNGRCNADPDSAGEGFGVNFVGAADLLIEGNLFVDNGPLLAGVRCGEVLGTGINTFEASGTLRGNAIFGTRGGAMLIEKSAGAFLVEGNHVAQNYFLALNNYWDAGIWIDESLDTTVRDNTFRDNWGGVGIMVSDEEGTYPDASKRTVILGNHIRDHIAGLLVWGYGACPPPADVITNWSTVANDNTLLDNDALDGTDRPLWCEPGFVGGIPPLPYRSFRFQSVAAGAEIWSWYNGNHEQSDRRETR